MAAIIWKQKVRFLLRAIYRATISNILERVKFKRRSRIHHKAFAMNRNTEQSRITTYHSKNQRNFLSELCDQYGSDKGESSEFGHPYSWKSHSYTDFYSRIFDHCRPSIEKIFECGIGTNDPLLPSSMGKDGKPGASLRVWREYFPNARIFGGDIDKRVLIQEDRIETFFLDQRNPQSILDYWKLVGVSNFDLMIDDGEHTFDAGTCLFKNSIQMLSVSGLYIIEDVLFEDLLKYRLFFDPLEYNVDFIILEKPNRNVEGNCLVVVRKIWTNASKLES